MTWADSIASWFEVFSNLWSGAQFGPAESALWPLNAVACGVIAVESFMMLHVSHSRIRRLAYGGVSFGGFAYLMGELGGEYTVVAPVETFFHWAMVFGLGAALYRKLGVVDAPNH